MGSYNVRYNWPIKEIRTVDDAINTLEELAKRGWIFRGQGKHDPLLALIDRGKLAYLDRSQKLWLEEKSIEQFLATVQFPADVIEQQILSTDPHNQSQLEGNRISILMLMQHYGTPTRLVDWTARPDVALYFAVTRNYGDHDDEDGEVWCFDEYGYEKGGFGPEQWNNNPEVKNASGEFDKNMPIIFSEKGPCREWIVLQDLQPKFHRMEKQKGYFTVTSSFDRDHALAIQKLFKNDIHCYCRCIIHKEIKGELRHILAEKDVTQGSLFPDSAGVAWALRKDIFDINP